MFWFEDTSESTVLWNHASKKWATHSDASAVIHYCMAELQFHLPPSGSARSSSQCRSAFKEAFSRWQCHVVWTHRQRLWKWKRSPLYRLVQMQMMWLYSLGKRLGYPKLQACSFWPGSFFPGKHTERETKIRDMQYLVTEFDRQLNCPLPLWMYSPTKPKQTHDITAYF